MALDVAAARAAVGQAALARDEGALRAIADSLPPLTAYAYERHRARAFANAIRGARDSAVAELCLGVAACPPASSTFVADSAQLRLLTGEETQLPPAPPAERRPVANPSARLLVSGAALAAAVAALVILPGRALDDSGRRAATGVAAEPRVPQRVVVVAEPPAAREVAPAPRPVAPADLDGGTATLVRASAPVAVLAPAQPRARLAAVTQPPPRPAPPASTPATPPAPTPPAPAPTAAAPVQSSTPTGAAAPTATTPARGEKGKALGKAQAPGQLAKTLDVPAPQPPATDPAPGPPTPHPGHGQGREQGRERQP